MAINKRTRAASESIGFLLIIGGILIALNVLSVFFFARIDLTKKRLFSLADGSKHLAASLDDQMDVVGYFTSDLPPPYNATERYVRDLLEEYQSASHGKIHVRFIDPDTDKLKEQAEKDGVPKVRQPHYTDDSAGYVDGYRGIVFKYLGDTKTIPAIPEDTSGLEYAITQRIAELVGKKHPVGILDDHGGPTLDKGLSTLQQEMPTYELRSVKADTEIPQDLSALLIIGPEKPFTEAELRRINQYVMNGGSIGVFGGGEKIDIQGQTGPSASKVDTQINELLGKWGVKVESNMVADAQCGRAPMRGPMGMTIPVPYPAIPIVTFDEEEQKQPVLFRLDQAMLPFTSTLSLTNALSGDKGVDVRTLARSSDNSWAIDQDNLSLTPRNPRDWPSDGPSGPFPLIVAVSGKLPSAFPSNAAMSSNGSDHPSHSDITAPDTAVKKVRVLVMGSSMFLQDALVGKPEQWRSGEMPPNLSLGLNAVDWLAQESDLIAIRAKNVEPPALRVPTGVTAATTAARDALKKQDATGVKSALKKRKAALEAWDGKKAGYRWSNMLGLPALFALFGVVRWRMRLAKKASLKV